MGGPGGPRLLRERPAWTMRAVIALSNVSKSFGRQALLTDASFQLDPGDRVGLVGPNGAGKSTLFRLIVGEEGPDGGAEGGARVDDR